jgi:RNA-directed DNA polymerase
LLEVFLDRVPRLRVAPKSVARFKGKLRALWRQGRGRSLGRTIEDLALSPTE